MTLEGELRSSVIALSNRSCVTSYKWSIVTTSCTTYVTLSRIGEKQQIFNTTLPMNIPDDSKEIGISTENFVPKTSIVETVEGKTI